MIYRDRERERELFVFYNTFPCCSYNKFLAGLIFRRYRSTKISFYTPVHTLWKLNDTN